MSKPVILYINQSERERLEFNIHLSSKYHIIAFSKLEDAIKAYDSKIYNIDLCIFAVTYPVFEFVDFLQKIRKQHTKQQLPILFTYPQDMAEFAARSMYHVQKGVNDIFVLPLDFKLLELRISTLLKIKNKLVTTSFSAPNVQRKLYLKRAFDIMAASSALLLLSPVLLLVILLIRIESKGKVFYASKRVGANYKVFRLFKFRTMYQNADQKLKQLAHLNQYQNTTTKTQNQELSNTCTDCMIYEKACQHQLWKDNGVVVCEKIEASRKNQATNPVFMKLSKDPRITRIGGFLRKTSIDELPQLINVLIGDMSLVGNRPLPLYEAEKLTQDATIQRFNAPAGITGLWQVTKRGKADMSTEERVALDNEYAQKHSFLLDMKIILRTFPALLQSEKV